MSSPDKQLIPTNCDVIKMRPQSCVSSQKGTSSNVYETMEEHSGGSTFNMVFVSPMGAATKAPGSIMDLDGKHQNKCNECSKRSKCKKCRKIIPENCKETYLKCNCGSYKIHEKCAFDLFEETNKDLPLRLTCAGCDWEKVVYFADPPHWVDFLLRFYRIIKRLSMFTIFWIIIPAIIFGYLYKIIYYFLVYMQVIDFDRNANIRWKMDKHLPYFPLSLLEFNFTISEPTQGEAEWIIPLEMTNYYQTTGLYPDKGHFTLGFRYAFYVWLLYMSIRICRRTYIGIVRRLSGNKRYVIKSIR